MGGKVLNYEAKDILNQGKREVAEGKESRGVKVNGSAYC